MMCEEELRSCVLGLVYIVANSNETKLSTVENIIDLNKLDPRIIKLQKIIDQHMMVKD